MKVEIESVGFGFAHGFGIKYIGVKVATPPKVKPIILDKTIKSIPLLGNILTGGKKGGLLETYLKIN